MQARTEDSRPGTLARVEKEVEEVAPCERLGLDHVEGDATLCSWLYSGSRKIVVKVACMGLLELSEKVVKTTDTL